VRCKIGMMSYMFSLHADFLIPEDGIAAATVGSIMNSSSEFGRFYPHTFEILLACTGIVIALSD